MWDTNLKKAFIRLQCEIQYGCAYVYARPRDSAPPYRFYFRIWGTDRMWSCVKSLHKRGFQVRIWRPPTSSFWQDHEVISPEKRWSYQH